jgi:hypothetical protein
MKDCHPDPDLELLAPSHCATLPLGGGNVSRGILLVSSGIENASHRQGSEESIMVIMCSARLRKIVI